MPRRPSNTLTPAEARAQRKRLAEAYRIRAERLAAERAAHDCLEHAEPFTWQGGQLNHGWRCSVCGELLQVG